MTWARIDDRANEHRKTLMAGAEACWLWVCGLMYANRQDAKDGFIPEQVICMLYAFKNPKKLAKKLVEVGLWEPVDGGYQIHDYHAVNPTRAQVEEQKKAARDRAAKSYENKKAKKQNSAGAEKTNKSAGRKQKKRVSSGVEWSGKNSKEEDIPIPPDWAPTDEHRERAKAAGLDVERQAVAFRAHAESCGRLTKRWNAAFTTWLLKREEEAKERAKAQKKPQQTEWEGAEKWV